MNNEADVSHTGLTPDLPAESFAGCYWLKAVLAAFCRTLGLSSTDDTRALQTRVAWWAERSRPNRNDKT